MINETEAALKEVILQTSTLISRLTNDPMVIETFKIALITISAGSFKCGYEKGRLAGRAE